MALDARVVLAAFPGTVLRRGRWAPSVLQLWMLASLLVVLPTGSTTYSWDSVSDFCVFFGVGLLHLDLVFNIPETNSYYDLSCPAG